MSCQCPTLLAVCGAIAMLYGLISSIFITAHGCPVGTVCVSYNVVGIFFSIGRLVYQRHGEHRAAQEAAIIAAGAGLISAGLQFVLLSCPASEPDAIPTAVFVIPYPHTIGGILKAVYSCFCATREYAAIL
jgi:hypothetical protein